MQETKYLGADFLRSFLYLYTHKEVSFYNNFDEIKNNILALYNLSQYIMIPTNQEKRQDVINKINDTLGVNLSYATPNGTIAKMSNFIIIANNSKEQELSDDILNFIYYLANKSSIPEITSECIKYENYENLKAEFEKQEISDTIQDVNTNSTLINRTSTLDNKIKTIQIEITNLLQQLKEKKENLYKTYGERQLKFAEKETIDKVISFLSKNKIVRCVKASKEQLCILTDFLPIQFTYNEDRIDKIIDANFSNEQIREILKDALLDRNEWVMMSVPVVFKIYDDASALGFRISKTFEYCIGEWKITNVNTAYRNYHWFEYSCLGGFSQDINLMQNDFNVIGLFSVLLQYYQTINLGDLAGNNWLTKQWNKIMYNKKENKYYMISRDQKSIKEIDMKHIENARYMTKCDFMTSYSAKLVYDKDVK